MQNEKNILKVSKYIELRSADIAFASELYEIINSQREFLRPWLRWIDANKHPSDTINFLKNAMLYNEGGQKLTTFIFYKNQLAGSIALVRIDKIHNSAEIGYWLRQDFQGNGIITQACKSLIDYSFKHRNINRIEIKIASQNKKSLAIPQRLGFMHEGTLRQALHIYDQYFDLELYSLLKGG